MSDELKVWEFDKPDVGRLFLVYTRWEDEPVMCKMGDDGPKHLSTCWDISYTGYDSGGGDLWSELDICKFARWCYVPPTPEWWENKS